MTTTDRLIVSRGLLFFAFAFAYQENDLAAALAGLASLAFVYRPEKKILADPLLLAWLTAGFWALAAGGIVPGLLWVLAGIESRLARRILNAHPRAARAMALMSAAGALIALAAYLLARAVSGASPAWPAITGLSLALPMGAELFRNLARGRKLNSISGSPF